MAEPISKSVREALRRFAVMGGNARKKVLTKARMKEIAIMGGKARQAKRNGS